jgi:hypothetical protein
VLTTVLADDLLDGVTVRRLSTLRDDIVDIDDAKRQALPADLLRTLI